MKSVAKLAFIGFLALFVVACGGKEEVKKAQTPKLEVKTDPKQNEKKLCNEGNITVCYELGLSYYDEKKFNEAFLYFGKVCDLGKMKFCANLANDYHNGNGVSKNPKKALEFYQKACSLNDAESCNNAGVMYDKGNGILQDYIKAHNLYKKGCDLNNNYSCNNLAWLYYDGKGVEKKLTNKLCFV